MPGKTVKCPVCSRSFGTKAALSQHKSSGPCVRRAKPKSSNPRASNSLRGAPVSVAVSVASNAMDTAMLSGVDRLAHVENVSSFAHGQVVFDEVVSASSFTRLALISAAYQKIKYAKLTFRVVPMLATSINGGYVAAFVRDPADIPPPKSEDLLNWITSQRGSVTTKWWQSTQISVPVADRSYYTSTSEEVREYSPGRLVLVVDGRASSSGPLTIFADWSVVLSHASLEKASAPGRPDHTTVLRNIWTKDQNTYCWSYDPAKTGDSGSPNPSFMFSDWAVGDLFMLSSGATIEEYKSGTSGDVRVENYWTLHVESVTGVRWRQHPDTTDSGLAAADDVLLIPRGLVLRRVEPAKFSGELMSPPSSQLGPSNGPQLAERGGPSGETLMQFCKNCEQSRRCSEKSPSCGTQPCDLEELSRLDQATSSAISRVVLRSVLRDLTSLVRTGLSIEDLGLSQSPGGDHSPFETLDDPGHA